MSNIKKKSREEIKLMKRAGHIVALCHKKVKELIEPGINTLEIDNLIVKIIKENKAIPTFLNYNGFPFSACISVNEQVVHGFPSKDVILKEGDIVSVDIGATFHGLCADSAWTYPVGNISDDCKMLLEKTEEGLFAGIDKMRANGKLDDVSSAIEDVANKNNLGIVRQYGGHGVGHNLHEEPFVYNYSVGNQLILKEGMTIAIEPMFNLGGDDVYTLADGWTVVTTDHKPSAHFEHTVLVTQDEPIIITQLQE